MGASRLLVLLATSVLAAGTIGALPARASAAQNILYVDGKIGSDANAGTSASIPFKTISKAASALPTGSGAAGWTIVVQGYTDYVYRERPVPAGWGRTGTTGAPIVFRAAGYVAAKTSYVKPIVSGADPAPSAGKTWTASSTAGVWWTPWASPPVAFGTSGGSSLPTAVFQDVTTWLWEQPSLSALGQRATTGSGGYWYDASAKRLYVSAASTTGTSSGTNPTGHAVDVIERSGFLFDGRSGADYVQVRGFEVRHSANGIAYLYGADYGTVADNVVTGNLYMGISVSGYQTSTGPDPAVGMTIWRNRGTRNTIQMIKLTSGVAHSSVCDNEAWGNGLQGIKVEGKPPGSSYAGLTSDVTICRNRLHHQSFNPTGSAYNNANGITIANGAQGITVSDNSIWSNDVGVMMTQEATGLAAMNGIAITRNRISANRRFGIYFFDGYRGSGAGRMTASFDTIWANGIGVMVDRGSTNKSLVHETVHANRAEGVKIGGVNVAKASIAMRESLVTSNGGYGIWLVTGNSASVSYTGLSGNARGAITGSVSATGNNTKPPGYISTDPASADHLRIATSSFQYTAGPSGNPIGARY